MAKVKQKIIKVRVKKPGKGYRTCNMCHGTGKVKSK